MVNHVATEPKHVRETWLNVKGLLFFHLIIDKEKKFPLLDFFTEKGNNHPMNTILDLEKTK